MSNTSAHYKLFICNDFFVSSQHNPTILLDIHEASSDLPIVLRQNPTVAFLYPASGLNTCYWCCAYLHICLLTLKLLENRGCNSLNPVSPIETRNEWPQKAYTAALSNGTLCHDGKVLYLWSSRAATSYNGDYWALKNVATGIKGLIFLFDLISINENLNLSSRCGQWIPCETAQIQYIFSEGSCTTLSSVSLAPITQRLIHFTGAMPGLLPWSNRPCSSGFQALVLAMCFAWVLFSWSHSAGFCHSVFSSNVTSLERTLGWVI